MEQIKTKLDMTLRKLQRTPTDMFEVPVGGPTPVVVMHVDMSDYDNELVSINVDATGFDDPEEFAKFIDALAVHIRTTPHDRMTSSGVEHVEPKESDT